MNIEEIPDAEDKELLSWLVECGSELEFVNEHPGMTFASRIVARAGLHNKIKAIKQELLRRLSK